MSHESDSKPIMKSPPIIHSYPEHKIPEEYVKYMHETFGHILESSEEIPKEVADFLDSDLPTLEDLPDWVTQEPEMKKDSLMKIGKKVSLTKKFETGIITEKEFNNLVKQLTLGESCDIKGNYSYKTHIILNFITDKLGSDKEFMAHLVIDRDPESLYYTVADIQRCRKELGAIEVWATDSEIKERMGLKRMSNREINKAVEDCADLEFEGKLYCYHDPITKRYKSYDVGGAEKHFFGFVREKSGKVARRTGYKENAYCFTFNTLLSNILLANMMNGNLQLQHNDFYQLRGGIQNMLNHTLMWERPTFINLKTACALFRITTKHIKWQQELCEENFNVAKRARFIDWSKFGKGSKVRYKITKKERLLQPKEVKLLPENT